jgi:Spx/MgsR family transcriptional regulator
MSVAFYGIPNCDTVRKARAWLDAKGIAYSFHDYKKEGTDPARLRGWIAAKGWETVLNRRGTAFRKLDPAQTTGLDADKALALMQANPSTIKRPVVEHPGELLVGFDPAEWERALGEGSAA